MKTNNKYEAPDFEFVMLSPEKGFAASSNGLINDLGEGGLEDY